MGNRDLPQLRKKILVNDCADLSDHELLALVLGNERVFPKSSQPLHQGCSTPPPNGTPDWIHLNATELMQQNGIGQAKACTLLAAVELARRIGSQNNMYQPMVQSSVDAYQLLKPKLALLPQEDVVVLALDSKQRVLSQRLVARGSATTVEVHPREVYGPLIRIGATSAIIAHNHPSGDPEPSSDDQQLTERLKQAGVLLGIPLLDHLVIGNGNYVSLADRGVL